MNNCVKGLRDELAEKNVNVCGRSILQMRKKAHEDLSSGSKAASNMRLRILVEFGIVMELIAEF